MENIDSDTVRKAAAQFLPEPGDYMTELELVARWAKAGMTLSRLRKWRERKFLQGPGYRRIGHSVVYPVELVVRYEEERTVIPPTR
jgi:hypothetical protein